MDTDRPTPSPGPAPVLTAAPGPVAGRRRWLAIAGWCGIVGGIAGNIANVLLILFYALAQPWHGHENGLFWLGSVNDVVAEV